MKIFRVEVKWEVWTGYAWFMVEMSGVVLQIGLITLQARLKMEFFDYWTCITFR